MEKQPVSKPAKQNVNQPKHVFDELKELLHTTCISYISRHLDDMPALQLNNQDFSLLNKLISQTTNIDQCYLKFHPSEKKVELVGFMKSMPRSDICNELETELNFNPFNQKGLLPADLCSKQQYSLEDIAGLLYVLDKKIGIPENSNFHTLQSYAQTANKLGPSIPVEESSLHPYLLAMTVLNSKKMLSKDRRLRFRNITAYTLIKTLPKVELLSNKAAWHSWAIREKDANGALVAFHEDQIHDLFIQPSPSAFCIASEALGKEYRKLRKGHRGKQSNDFYSTEGFMACEAYTQLIRAYMSALVVK